MAPERDHTCPSYLIVWTPHQATESQGEDEDEGERLKKAEAAPKPKAKDGNVEMLKMLKTLVRKVHGLEDTQTVLVLATAG